ncbi:MAG: hypothetical protein NZ772_02315 [Cyanobacteria bacterium]|nr:hypothetical protein [Cyanobacteriota bacterium]MDW8200304.1 hypothetical protein [Cyanobacteriota bacterium SKYGB_h_bin112]
MTEQLNSDRQTLDLLRNKLLPLAQRIASFARGSRGAVGLLLVVAALSALWLMLFLQELFNFSVLTAVAVLVVLALPAIVLGIFYIALQKAVGLVDEVNQLINAISATLDDSYSQAQNLLQTGARQQLAIGSLFSLGSALRELLSLVDDVGGLALKVKTLLLTFNPFYLGAVLISVLATIVLAIASIITGIVMVSV